MNDYLHLNGVTHIFDDNLSNNLLYGVMDFFNWGLLNAGGFSSVTLSSTKSTLRPVNDPRYTTGQIWESFRNNWVWENNIDYTAQPITISGLYVNSVFIPNNSGYYVNYKDGQVVFTTPPSGTSIQIEHSYRTANVFSINNKLVPELFFGSDQIQSDFASPSGSRHALTMLRRQLPFIAIDINQNLRFSPLQIGGGQWCYVDAIFYILAESDYERRSLSDLVALQNNKTIWLYDRETLKASGFLPLNLDYNGRLVTNPKTYPDLSTNYRWRTASFSQTRAYNYDSLPYNLYGAIVKTTFIVPMGNI